MGRQRAAEAGNPRGVCRRKARITANRPPRSAERGAGGRGGGGQGAGQGDPPGAGGRAGGQQAGSLAHEAEAGAYVFV